MNSKFYNITIFTEKKNENMRSFSFIIRILYYELIKMKRKLFL